LKNNIEKPGVSIVTNPSWGAKRNCPSCNAHFYDLNKQPVACPKCKHTFDPAVASRAKRKSVRREEAKEQKEVATATVLATKKMSARQKDKKDTDKDGAEEGGISDIAEIEDVDDIENLQELSELEEREEVTVNEDDADDETIIGELGTGEKVLVENVEEEEASALSEELSEEEGESSAWKKKKPKKQPK
jgi:uncharacterized protein (TIGR02300 family)